MAMNHSAGNQDHLRAATLDARERPRMRGRIPSDGPIGKAEMNARRLDDIGGLATTHAWRVDAVCQRFEAEWRAEREPRIEDFLPQADQPQRAALFRELLALEL